MAGRSTPTVHVILDLQLREQLEAYIQQHSLTQSQAVRLLLALALDEKQPREKVWRRQAFIEGVLAGSAALRRGINEAISKAMQSSDQEVGP